MDTVAEWLRRWTRNPLGSARVGSNPTGVDFDVFVLVNVMYFVIGNAGVFWSFYWSSERICGIFIVHQITEKYHYFDNNSPPFVILLVFVVLFSTRTKFVSKHSNFLSILMKMAQDCGDLLQKLHEFTKICIARAPDLTDKFDPLRCSSPKKRLIVNNKKIENAPKPQENDAINTNSTAKEISENELENNSAATPDSDEVSQVCKDVLVTTISSVLSNLELFSDNNQNPPEISSEKSKEKEPGNKKSLLPTSAADNVPDIVKTENDDNIVKKVEKKKSKFGFGRLFGRGRSGSGSSVFSKSSKTNSEGSDTNKYLNTS